MKRKAITHGNNKPAISAARNLEGATEEAVPAEVFATEDAKIFLESRAIYEELIATAYGRSSQASPAPNEARAIARKWIKKVRELRAYADGSTQARDFLAESEAMRQVLIVTLCDEIGEKWHLIEGIHLSADEVRSHPLHLVLGHGDLLRVGWLLLIMDISRPFLDEAMQRDQICRRLLRRT
jgi:hypothetical protein